MTTTSRGRKFTCRSNVINININENRWEHCMPWYRISRFFVTTWRHQYADCRWFTQLDFFAEVVYDWYRQGTLRYTGTTVFLETVYYRRAFSLPHPAVWPQQTRAQNGALPCRFWGWGARSPSNNIAWAKAYLRTKWHPDPSSPLVTIDVGQKLGDAVHLFVGDRLDSWVSYLIKCRLGRGLPA